MAIAVRYEMSDSLKRFLDEYWSAEEQRRQDQMDWLDWIGAP